MNNVNNKRTRQSWLKIAATGGILLGAAAIVGSGAFAVWTSSSTATASLNAGSVEVAMSNSHPVFNGMAPGDTVQQLLTISFPQSTVTGNQVTGLDFSVSAGTEKTGTNPSIAGGPTTARYLDGTGSSLFTGSVASDASTVAYSDGTLGLGAAANSSALVYKIDTCSVPWVKAGSDAFFSCSADQTATAGGDSSVLNGIQKNTALKLYPIAFGNSTVASTPGANQTPFKATAGNVTLYSMISITLPWSANNSFEGASVPLEFTVSAEQRAGVTIGS